MTTLQLWFAIGAVLAVVIIVAGTFIRHLHKNDRLPAPVLFALRIALGITFAVLGVIGSLLPIMQGWIFFLLAVLVLFPKSKFAIGACDKIEPKMPRLVRWLRARGIGVPDPNRPHHQ